MNVHFVTFSLGCLEYTFCKNIITYKCTYLYPFLSYFRIQVLQSASLLIPKSKTSASNRIKDQRWKHWISTTVSYTQEIWTCSSFLKTSTRCLITNHTSSLEVTPARLELLVRSSNVSLLICIREVWMNLVWTGFNVEVVWMLSMINNRSLSQHDRIACNSNIITYTTPPASSQHYPEYRLYHYHYTNIQCIHYTRTLTHLTSSPYYIDNRQHGCIFV